MSWETHGGRRYYTRSCKRSGKITRLYVGRGDIAETCFELDLWKRRQRLKQQAQRREKKAADDRLDALLDDLCLLADAALLAAGFHKHKGEWRRKRRGK